MPSASGPEQLSRTHPVDRAARPFRTDVFLQEVAGAKTGVGLSGGTGRLRFSHASPANTMIMISAAAVTIRPVVARPSATARVLAAAVPSESCQNSRIREMRNTS